MRNINVNLICCANIKQNFEMYDQSIRWLTNEWPYMYSIWPICTIIVPIKFHTSWMFWSVIWKCKDDCSNYFTWYVILLLKNMVCNFIIQNKFYNLVWVVNIKPKICNAFVNSYIVTKILFGFKKKIRWHSETILYCIKF